MNIYELEERAKQDISNPDPIIAQKAQRALARIQEIRTPEGLANIYTHYSRPRSNSSFNATDFYNKLSNNSPWAGQRPLNSVKFDADTFGAVNGQKTWDRQKDEAAAFGKLNGDWTQAGRANESALTGYDPATGRMSYPTQVQERSDFGIDPYTGQQTMNKINNDRNYGLQQQQFSLSKAKAYSGGDDSYDTEYKRLRNEKMKQELNGGNQKPVFGANDVYKDAYTMQNAKDDLGNNVYNQNNIIGAVLNSGLQDNEIQAILNRLRYSDQDIVNYLANQRPTSLSGR